MQKGAISGPIHKAIYDMSAQRLHFSTVLIWWVACQCFSSHSQLFKYNISFHFLAAFIIFSIFISHYSPKWRPTLWNYPTEVSHPEPDVEQFSFSSEENLVLIPGWILCAGMYQQKTETLLSPRSSSVCVCVCLAFVCTIHKPVSLHTLHISTSLKIISAQTGWSQQAPPSALTLLIDWWNDLRPVIKCSVTSWKWG